MPVRPLLHRVSIPRRAIAPAIVLLAILATPIGAQSIRTIAGGGTEEGRPATAVTLNEPVAVAYDSAGNLYIGERETRRVRVVAAGSGIVTLIAGNGNAGFAGDGAAARDAEIRTPDGLALLGTSRLFIADRENHRIRAVDLTTGIITTVAGNGKSGFGGDGGPATAAMLNFPQDVAVDLAGNLFVADWFNNRVRRVDAATGIITTFAGTGGAFSGDGGPATAAGIDVDAIELDSAGNLFVIATIGHRIRKISAQTRIITTVAGTGTGGFSGDGGPATAAQISQPGGVAVDRDGTVYIADAGNRRIRKVSPGGTITSLATITFQYPLDVALESTARLAVSDSSRHRIYAIDLTTFATTNIAGNGSTTFNGDGGPATSAVFDLPGDVTVDVAGTLYVSDGGRVRKIANGLVTTAVFLQGDNVAVDSKGTFYAADFDRNLVRKVVPGSNQITIAAGTGFGGYSGDGGPATAAQLNDPNDVAVDATGNLYIADFGNHRIRRVDAATGIITTIAGNGTFGFSGDGGPATQAQIGSPRDMAVDSQGAVYIADTGTERVRKVSPSGIITTIAGNGTRLDGPDGGPATATSLCCFTSLAVDSGGNVYIPVFFSNRVRRVDAITGIISTFAGTGSSGFSGDNGPATQAKLDYPNDVAIDADGTVFILDAFNNRVRRVASCGAVAMPQLITPSDGSSGVPVSPSLRWSRSQRAERYDVLFGTTNPPTTVVASGVEGVAFNPGNLMPSTTYYWRVVARGDPFCNPPQSTPSAVRSFTTGSTCAPPPAPGI